MDCKKVSWNICKFIKNYCNGNGITDGVIGVSGGVDSAIVAILTREALGAEHTHLVSLPDYSSGKNEVDQDKEDAYKISEICGSRIDTIYIENDLTSLSFRYAFSAQLAQANMKSRLRMIYLYGKANQLQSEGKPAIVVGTTNAAEAYVGYATKYGDGGVDIEPIIGLLKREVYEIAKYLGVPESILNKKPSARLYPGQTDEDELGISYDDIDNVVTYECFASITNDGIDKETLNKIKKLSISTRHKFSLPASPSRKETMEEC